ncbi:alpha/beta fold hydrolase [Roseicyclus marinus]|uniref:alpha/beta fold hydrolase n=1 Tax=Roseicyclus marinus TaxID=2161673 RepID=UPI00241043EC|nr:alpha/beta hydrolase [Roseicyclus marinus]MDG3043081.1 alpha/beta hydrolase [Roseicyclus marinus]
MEQHDGTGRAWTRRGFGKRILSVGAVTAAAACAAPDRGADGAGAESPPLDRSLPPPPGHMALVNNLEVHADIRGRGRDVVLLHGAGGNARDFTFQLAPLLAERGYRVISFDRPGLGWSQSLGDAGIDPRVQARHLEQAAVQFGVRRPIVLGHSYGGAVAMAWALNAQEGVSAPVSGLVSVAGATNTWPGGVGLWYDLVSTRFGGRVVAPVLTGLVNRDRAQRAVASVFAPNPVPEGYLDHIGIGFSLDPDRLMVNARQVAGLKTHVRAMEPRYGGLRMPLAIVFGTRDTTVPLDVHGERLAQQVPGAHLEVLADVGHMPHHTRPDAILAAIDRVRNG